MVSKRSAVRICVVAPFSIARLAQQVRARSLLDKLTVFKNYIMRNSKEIGNLTELQCITALYELGCDVSIPFGNSQKYDVIIDYNNKLYRVQIKHANEHWEDDELAYFNFKTRCKRKEAQRKNGCSVTTAPKPPCKPLRRSASRSALAP